MSNSPFNPIEFFGKTAHFASQGRGLFTIPKLPVVLGGRIEYPATQQFNELQQRPEFRAGFSESDTVNIAAKLLQKGIMAKSVTSPGSALATFEEFSYIGPTRKQAHTQIFGPLSVDFYLMGQSREEAQSLYHTFMLWHEKIAGARLSTGELANGLRSDSTFFAIEYYDNYVTDANFQVLSPLQPTTYSTGDTEFAPIIHNKYYEIYPQNVGQLTTSWDNQDAPLTLSVEFEFYYMQANL